jgi:serine/threonine protein kinase
MASEIEVRIDRQGGVVHKRGITPAGSARVAREVLVLEALADSRHVPEVVDVELYDDMQFQMTTRLVSGPTFKEVFEISDSWSCEPQSWESVAPYLGQFVDADMDLMRRGGLYRDLNLNHLVYAEDRAVLLDNEATVMRAEDDDKWWFHNRRGTWETMAPEEFAGRGLLDTSVATYRAAVLSHLALSGTLPFPRFPIREAVHIDRKLHAPQVSRDLPTLAREALRIALDPKEKGRYRTPAELMSVLEAAYGD